VSAVAALYAGQLAEVDREGYRYAGMPVLTIELSLDAD